MKQYFGVLFSKKNKTVPVQYLWWAGIVAILSTIAAITFYCLYMEQKKFIHKENPSTAQITEKDASLINEVRMLVSTPDEIPTIATVSNPEKLRGQEFFINSQIGDKVLLYNTWSRAILYRPSTKQIINIAPLAK